jgi:hypothetical protein
MREDELRGFVRNACEYVVSMLGHRGLVSLYLAGTILTSDRTPHSDIDLFGIVTQDFDILAEEDRINAAFEAHDNGLCGGIPTRFRAVGLDELAGGPIRGRLARYIGLSAFARDFPFFERLWGDAIDITVFKIEPLDARAEATRLIASIEAFLTSLDTDALFPLQDFPKAVLRLVRVEAVHLGFAYEPSYRALEQHFNMEPEHIVHTMMHLRDTHITKRAILDTVDEVRAYLSKISDAMTHWD